MRIGMHYTEFGTLHNMRYTVAMPLGCSIHSETQIESNRCEMCYRIQNIASLWMPITEFDIIFPLRRSDFGSNAFRSASNKHCVSNRNGMV